MRLILALGLTLFEVLISLLILSLVLLGLDVMELSALRLNRKAYFSAVAEQQLHNMEERLSFLGALGDPAQQIERWNGENKRLLPLGAGRVQGHYPLYTITLYWGGEQAGYITEDFSL